MSPGIGLVGLPAWFWVDGYDGRPITSSRTDTLPPAVGDDVPTSAVPANDPRRRPQPITVEVTVWPTRYQWAFGDGATLSTASVGRAYPQESDVQHTYDTSSLRTSGGFRAQLTIDFAATYRVNGGPPQPLAGTQRTFDGVFRVQEIQSVLGNS